MNKLQTNVTRVFVVLEEDRGCGPMVEGVFASLEAAKAYLAERDSSRCWIVSEEGHEVLS